MSTWSRRFKEINPEGKNKEKGKKDQKKKCYGSGESNLEIRLRKYR